MSFARFLLPALTVAAGLATHAAATSRLEFLDTARQATLVGTGTIVTTDVPTPGPGSPTQNVSATIGGTALAPSPCEQTLGNGTTCVS